MKLRPTEKAVLGMVRLHREIENNDWTPRDMEPSVSPKIDRSEALMTKEEFEDDLLTRDENIPY